MKELSFLEIIKNTLTDSSHLGDDCAFLKDLNIYVTQDTLVENVHFSLYTTTPYLLGRKSIAVNLSDLAAALSTPRYVSISISIPKTLDETFIKEFYKGVNDICNEFDVKVIGGDITSSDIVVVSVCAIGYKDSSFFAKRSNAKKDYCVILAGNHGSSSAGLYALSNFLYAPQALIDAHLNPVPRITESKIISKILDSDIATMDTSDGLADALFKIAEASKHSIEIDINKIPVEKELIDFSLNNEKDYKDFVLWGGEDFGLVLCVPEDLYQNLDEKYFTCIGRVLNKDFNPSVVVRDGQNSKTITKSIFCKKTYNHFKD